MTGWLKLNQCWPVVCPSIACAYANTTTNIVINVYLLFLIHRKLPHDIADKASHYMHRLGGSRALKRAKRHFETTHKRARKTQ